MSDLQWTRSNGCLQQCYTFNEFERKRKPLFISQIFYFGRASNRLRRGATEEEITIKVAQHVPDVNRRGVSTRLHFPQLTAVSPVKGKSNKHVLLLT